MRIFPLVLIAIGVFGVLKHYGLIDPNTPRQSTVSRVTSSTQNWLR